MSEKKFCILCNRDVEIRKIITHGNYEEQILTCDHIGGRLKIQVQMVDNSLHQDNKLLGRD